MFLPFSLALLIFFLAFLGLTFLVGLALLVNVCYHEDLNLTTSRNDLSNNPGPSTAFGGQITLSWTAQRKGLGNASPSKAP
jgi:hypothetical protein